MRIHAGSTMRVGVVAFDGTRLSFLYRSGHGTPVVFFHGTTFTAHAWDEVVARLDPTRTVYCINARGHGASGPSRDGDYRVEAHVGDLVQFLETVTGPAVIVGHSLGGTVGFHTAGLRPDLVRALYIEDVTPYVNADMERLEATPLIGLLLQVGEVAAEALAEHHQADWLAERIAAIGPAGLTFGDVMSASYLQEWADGVAQADPRVLGSQLSQPVSFDIDAALAAIRCPIHVARGDVALGSLVTDNDVERLSSGRPEVTETRFAGVGHAIHSFALYRYVDDLSRFLADHP